jgi:hypothetical protein
MQEQLDQINALHLWDFEVAKNADGVVLILGSNDFTYYHYLEAEFRGVAFCDLPARFAHAEFRLGKDGVVWVKAEPVLDAAEREYEIQASELEVRIGKVFYYRR